MVAKIVCGKSIRGVLNYNENKVANSEAALLMACGFPRNPEDLSFRNKLDRFEILTRQNENTRTNAMHITLNFSRDDVLDKELLKQIALDYMDRIGFGDQPFLVYQHFDAAHPHIHLATVNIADGGSRIETHNIGKNQSEKARKEIEINYGLIRAEDQVKEMAYMLKPVNLEKAIYGKSETKAAISSIVREVTSSYKFTSLAELNAVLGQFNVLAYPGAEGTRMKEKGGLVYCLLNDEREAVGIPIKASSIFSSPTLKNLEKKFLPNKESRKPYGERLKHLIDKAMRTAGSREQLEEMLRVQGLRILYRENAEGLTYGVTFIDNATRVIFNGSDLGKAYSAKAFMERLAVIRPKEKNTRENVQAVASDRKVAVYANDMVAASTAKNYPAADQPVIFRLLDIALANRYEAAEPDPYRRKKKKKIMPE